jgi:8-oxo-dGTP pyrophosphatase MutT (NUDIX family)
LRALVAASDQVHPEELARFRPPPSGGRPSAVLILFASGADGPEVLLIQRAATLNSHAGQPAFPGGATDPGDGGPAGTALREAAEEVGLEPAGVTVLAELPALHIPISGFDVTPVLAWWHTPTPVFPKDRAEVAAVHRVPIGELVDPVNRFQVAHPWGFVGPAFAVRGMVVWGFTAGLLSRLIELAGWSQPWNSADVRQLPDGPVEPGGAGRGGPVPLPASGNSGKPSTVG